MNEGIRVSLISLGCARNLVDSEVLLGHVVQEGLAIARDPEDADVVVVNTCGFVEDAKQESVDTLLEACRLKSEGLVKGVVAVGCLAQRYTSELRDELASVDAVVGISDYSGIPDLVRKIVNGSSTRYAATVDGGQPKSARSDLGRLLLTPQSYAYLRISEGCDHACAFCAIPSMRGRNRSKPMDVLVDEARQLAAQGVRELVVVAEDSTAYGLDTDRERRIHSLIEALAEVEGVEWVRLMYAYPHTVRPELTAVMREHPKVVPYLDIPVQHISSNMLRAMRRGTKSEQVRGILDRLRDEVPGIAVRTTFIVGFPGETDADFAELRDFVAEYRFERMGAFTYSDEESTAAYQTAGQVEREVAEQRRAELMLLQQKIIGDCNRALVGTRVEVIVDGVDADQSSWIGRTKADAPEVDCAVRLPRDGAFDVAPGAIVRAEVDAVEGYDLRATTVGVLHAAAVGDSA